MVPQCCMLCLYVYGLLPIVLPVLLYFVVWNGRWVEVGVAAVYDWGSWVAACLGGSCSFG